MKEETKNKADLAATWSLVIGFSALIVVYAQSIIDVIWMSLISAIIVLAFWKMIKDEQK